MSNTDNITIATTNIISNISMNTTFISYVYTYIRTYIQTLHRQKSRQFWWYHDGEHVKWYAIDGQLRLYHPSAEQENDVAEKTLGTDNAAQDVADGEIDARAEKNCSSQVVPVAASSSARQTRNQAIQQICVHVAKGVRCEDGAADVISKSHVLPQGRQGEVEIDDEGGAGENTKVSWVCPDGTTKHVIENAQTKKSFLKRRLF